MSARATAARVLHVAEPSPAFLGRPPIVVDCSVLSAVLFQEDTSDDALRIVSGKSLHAPFLLGTELASVAVKKSRGGWPASRVEAALDKYLEQEIELHTADVHGMYSLAVRYGLSAYDAAYLWVAALLQAPLATFDAKLAKAARTHLSNPR